MKLVLLLIAIRCLVSAQNVEEELLFTKIGTYTDSASAIEKSYWVPKHFKAQWYLTRSICKAYDFDIVTLDTLAEMQVVSRMCSRHAHLFGAYTHIGGATTTGRSTSEWYWVHKNDEVSYNMIWKPGQPDHYGNNEWCLTLAKDSGFKFNDINCHGSWEEKFICQKIESLPMNPRAGSG